MKNLQNEVDNEVWELQQLALAMKRQDRYNKKLDKFLLFIVACVVFVIVVSAFFIYISPKRSKCEFWKSPIEFSGITNSWRDSGKIYLTTFEGNIYVIDESRFIKKECGEE